MRCVNTWEGIYTLKEKEWSQSQCLTSFLKGCNYRGFNTTKYAPAASGYPCVYDGNTTGHDSRGILVRFQTRSCSWPRASDGIRAICSLPTLIASSTGIIATREHVTVWQINAVHVGQASCSHSSLDILIFTLQRLRLFALYSTTCFGLTGQHQM
jgi:hypothetical protein